MSKLTSKAAIVPGASKGIGEPPLLLATAVWTALKDAIASAAGTGKPVSLDAPATPERVLQALESARGAA